MQNYIAELNSIKNTRLKQNFIAQMQDNEEIKLLKKKPGYDVQAQIEYYYNLCVQGTQLTDRYGGGPCRELKNALKNDDVRTTNAKNLLNSLDQPFSQYLERFEMVVSDNKEHQKIDIPVLIGVATFSGGRTMKVGERKGKRSYELIRFASLKGYVVVGGMDKLLKAFTNEHEPDDIMSYIDRDWSDGRSYDKLGFEKIDTSLPQIFFINHSTMERMSVNVLTTEMDDNYLKVFNAGSVRYIKHIMKKSSINIIEDLANEFSLKE